MKDKLILATLKAKTSKTRWNNYYKTQPRSKVRGKVLLIILKRAASQRERWRVYSTCQNRPRLRAKVLRVITRHCKRELRRAKNQNQRWKVYKESPVGSFIEKKALRQYYLHATIKQKERIFIHAPSDCSIRRKVAHDLVEAA